MEALRSAAAIGDATSLGDPSSFPEGDLSEIQSMESDENLCGICEAIVVERGLLDCCDHMFCFSCIEDWATVTNLCPMCKAQFKFLTVVTTTGETVQGSSESSFHGKSVSEEAFSYFIDEEAIACLDGDDCKLRMQALQTALVDTSVACDKCDRWYHACCVGFDPGKSNERTWLCPRCAPPGDTAAEESDAATINKKEDEPPSMSFSFMESGESAIVVSMVGGKETNEQKEAIHISEASSSLHNPREQTSLDKLFEDLGKQSGMDDDDADDEEMEEREDEQELKHAGGSFEDFGEEQGLEDFGFGEIDEEQELDFPEDEERQQEVEQRREEPLQDVEPKTDKDEKIEEESGGPSLVASDATETPARTAEEANLTKIEELVSDDDSDIKKLELKPRIDKDHSENLLDQKKIEKKVVRTRLIMRRETEDLSLAEKIRQQVAAAAGDGAQVTNESLLAAYKAAVVKREGPKQKKAADSGRENLKRKLYGGIRGRRVYDRDWDVSFWRDKVLGDRSRKQEQGEEKIESTSRPPDSILDRICLADCSLLPKKEGYRPPPVTEDKPRPKPPFRSVPKPSETQAEAPAEENVAKDKKQWALELLARKNKQQVRSSDKTLKGNFVQLQKLPLDMRPSIEPNPRSKIPSAVRQIQLNRLTEHYLKNVKVGRNQASTDAVDAALAKEAEIFLRSNSKGVYVNLCVRALARGDAPAKAKAEPSKDAIAEALLATGLISESPPGSPVAQEEAAPESANERTLFVSEEKESFEPKILVNPGTGKQGLTALLEHLKKEEEPQVSAMEPEVSLPSETVGKEVEVRGNDASATDAITKEEQNVVPALTADEKTSGKDEPQENKPSGVSDCGKTSEDDVKVTDKKERTLKQKDREAAKVETSEPEQRDKDRNSRKHPRPEKQTARSRKKDKVDAEDRMGDDKLSELDLRIDRVRSSVAQHFAENSDIAQQIRETSRAVDHRTNSAPKSRKPSGDHHPRLHKSSPSVQEQVEMYVKEHIRPLFKSGVIKGEQYQWTVSKTTAKVMQHHKDAMSAEFLISEGGRVKKLAEQYLQRFAQEKKEGKN